jgi:hypothetical protein
MGLITSQVQNAKMLWLCKVMRAQRLQECVFLVDVLLHTFAGPIPDNFKYCNNLREFNVQGTKLTPPVCLCDYANLLSTANATSLVSGWASSVSHGVEGDPASIAPSISALVPVLKAKPQVKQQIADAAANITSLEEQMEVHAASSDWEAYDNIHYKLLPDAQRKLAYLKTQDAALSSQLTSAHLACYYLSCNGFFLNYHRLLGLLVLVLGGCLLVLNLLISAEPHEVPLPVISAEEEESASTSAYAMLKKHCKHVPAGESSFSPMLTAYI